jgi:hypothetical protein
MFCSLIIDFIIREVKFGECLLEILSGRLSKDLISNLLIQWLMIEKKWEESKAMCVNIGWSIIQTAFADEKGG